MPIYACFCPDYPNALDKRIANRPAHLEMGKVSGDSGEKVFGRAFVSDDHAHSSNSSTTPSATGADHPGMAGSVMLYRFSTLEEAWDRIKKDPYWIGGVWDKERTAVKELMGASVDATMRIAS